MVHDGSLEVHYSESAAKVLKLIEELKYRLNTREALIDKIRCYREQESQIPEISRWFMMAHLRSIIASLRLKC